jgi:hypothetical protein
MSADRRVEYMPIAEIEPAPRNPKLHAADLIAASIDRYGLAELPLIDERTGRLVAGHGRLDDLIARRRDGEDPPAGVKLGPGGAGDWLVPVIRGWSSASDEDAEAYLVTSNRLTVKGGWDNEGLADLLSDLADQDADLLAVTGYDADDLAALLAAGEPERTELPDAGPGDSRDRSSTPAREPLTVPGDMWALGNHRVYCGDATDPLAVDRLLAEFDQLPDLVHTDPPYGINVVGKDGKVGDKRGSRASPTSGGGNKFVATTQYEPVAGDDTTDAAADAYRLLAALLPEAVQVWWGANHYSGSAGLPDSPCWLVWDKQTNGDFADAELAWTNHTGSVRRLIHLWNGMARASEKTTKRVHPTQKPVALAEWAFGIVDKKAARRLVLDVFAGAGVTVLAAEATGRACAAMELSPAYVDVICRRWQEMTGRKPERITDAGRVPVDFTGDAA